MTDVIAPPLETPDQPGVADGHDALGGHEDHGPTGILKWLTSTDHKVIGLSYMITAIVIFYVSGIMALVMRLQLASPHSSLLSFGQFNALFTMHGSLMLYLFAGPFAFGGLANYIVPLQIGAPDMAFPRLNVQPYVGVRFNRDVRSETGHSASNLFRQYSHGFDRNTERHRTHRSCGLRRSRNGYEFDWPKAAGRFRLSCGDRVVHAVGHWTICALGTATIPFLRPAARMPTPDSTVGLTAT